MKKNIFELRPTQFSLGLKEVDFKVKKLAGMKSSEQDEFLKDRLVPVVKFREKQYHVVDHHHLVRACWEVDIEEVFVEVIEDFSEHDEDEFWKKMRTKKLVHLYDQFGKGPHDHTLLPYDIRGLADDPYRSLAWMIREDGGFDKVETPFFEFKWADFFRDRVLIERTEKGFDVARKEAMKLAHSEEAKHLPGFKAKK